MCSRALVPASMSSMEGGSPASVADAVRCSGAKFHLPAFAVQHSLHTKAALFTILTSQQLAQHNWVIAVGWLHHSCRTVCIEALCNAVLLSASTPSSTAHVDCDVDWATRMCRCKTSCSSCPPNQAACQARRLSAPLPLCRPGHCHPEHPLKTTLLSMCTQTSLSSGPMTIWHTA